MAFFDTLNKLRQNARYARTRDELQALPLDTRVDLGINGREREVARRAVFG